VYEVAKYDLDDSAQISLDIRRDVQPAELIQPGNATNLLRLVRKGEVIEFWANEQRLLSEATGPDLREPVDLGLVVAVQSSGPGQGELAAGFSELIVFPPR
jgi:hypothetical protein